MKLVIVLIIYGPSSNYNESETVPLSIGKPGEDCKGVHHKDSKK